MGELLVYKPKHAKEKFIKKLIISVIVLLLSVLMVAPFIYMISASFKYNNDIQSQPLKLLIPGKINLNNYKALIFSHQYFFKWYWNSIYTVIAVVIFRGIVVTMAAYAFARLEFRGKDAIFLILISSIMITPDTTIVARYLLYKYIGLLDTTAVIIIPSTFDAFFIFLLRQFFMGIPKELTEAARIDGCSHFKIYYKIILPLAKPALITMALFTFIWTWNDFINPFIFITNLNKELLTAGLQYFQLESGADISMQMAGACMAIIPPVILFSFCQKFFIKGIASSGIKG